MNKKTLILFGIYFLIGSLSFKFLILPFLPNLNGGNGLLKGDSVVFHQAALGLSQNVLSHGWRAWTLFPGVHSFNVGLLGALYVFFGPSPLVILPFNIAAQILTAYLIYRIGRRLWPGNIGEIGGIIGACLFVLFLSPLVWFSQIHKDTFVLPAVLIILLGFFTILNSQLTNKAFFKVCLAGVGALAVIFLMRPNYYCLIFSAFLILSLLVLVFFGVFRRGPAVFGKMRQSFLFVGAVSAFSLCTLALPSSYLRSEFTVSSADVGFVWDKSSSVPPLIDQYLEKVSCLRAHFINHSISVGAGSGIDLEAKPKNAAEVFAYLPRAMWIGLFAPFPSQWLEKMSAIRLVSSVETFLWYLFSPGVVYLAIRKPSPAFWAGTIFCLGMITLFSYVNPNLGTLYRVRFGFWFFFLTCGAVGWAGVLLPLVESAGLS